MSLAILPLICSTMVGCGGQPSLFAGPLYGADVVTRDRATLRRNDAEIDAISFNTIYEFALLSGLDGYDPMCDLINVGGTFFGTTEYGGKSGSGTVFSLTPSGREKIIHSFNVRSDGANPEAALTYSNGVFYGTTAVGGAEGYGTVFEVAASGAFHVIHNFGAKKGDGQYPVSTLVDIGGVLYGTTTRGGSYGLGTVFSLTKAGVETILHNFGASQSDGALPFAGLTDLAGTLYGVTASGGTKAFPCFGVCGTAFSITPTKSYKTIHDFNGAGGAEPVASMIAVGGDLYGTTEFGGSDSHGTVFEMTPTGTEKVLHNFKGAPSDGSAPVSDVTYYDGTLYGTTSSGGSAENCDNTDGDNCGVVFALSTSGKETVLHNFDNLNFPYGGVLRVGNELYGTTSGGVVDFAGTVFSLSI